MFKQSVKELKIRHLQLLGRQRLLELELHEHRDVVAPRIAYRHAGGGVRSAPEGAVEPCPGKKQAPPIDDELCPARKS